MSHPKPVNTAQVSLPLPAPYLHALLVSTIRKQVATVQQCTAYSTQTTVQTACTNLLTGTTTLDGTLTAHGTATALVLTLAGQRDNEVADVLRLHSGLVTALNLASNGDQATALAWTGSIKQRVRTPPTTDPPASPAAVPVNKASGEVQASCAADRKAKCYIFQMGTDPAHPEAWAAPVMVPGCKYRLPGQTIGQKLYFRIAVFRSNGQGQWSDMVSVTVK
jgi:hypothetical protein